MAERNPEMDVSPQDLDILASLADNERSPLALDVAAKLERQGLIMSGWSSMHVLTAAGLSLLRARS